MMLTCIVRLPLYQGNHEQIEEESEEAHESYGRVQKRVGGRDARNKIKPRI